MKKKLKQSEEFIVGGYIPNGKTIDELIVGRFGGKRLKFVAAVDDGIVPATRRQVFEQLAGIQTTACPFANLPEKRSSRRSPMDTKKMDRGNGSNPESWSNLPSMSGLPIGIRGMPNSNASGATLSRLTCRRIHRGNNWDDHSFRHLSRVPLFVSRIRSTSVARCGSCTR